MVFWCLGLCDVVYFVVCYFGLVLEFLVIIFVCNEVVYLLGIFRVLEC